MTKGREIELLAPAGNADIAIEAIKHGADAIYIGPPSHGARKSASNSLEDIRRVVDFAHIFNASVYVTVNTIIYEKELRDVEKMIRDLYRIGVDALIVQDMGILRMDIPPIALHASTQCDIRTAEKARFLQEAGFSQIVLARELSLNEIHDICSAVDIPVEVFIHGALCVSYSGRCSAGFACTGRSGNRGECTQICRLPFSLKDASGKVIARDKYLLSLKDFRAEDYLEDLIRAGVSSFKIEGRLKEAGYVKNVTAFYNQKLDNIISGLNTNITGDRPAEKTYSRKSCGTVRLKFTPDLQKSFNRGFTDYRLPSYKLKPDGGIRPAEKNTISSPLTPKSIGEQIKDINQLRPGDGISFFDNKGNFNGVLINGIKHGKIIGNRPFSLPKGAPIYRTSSVEWKKLMASDTANRTISIDISLSGNLPNNCPSTKVSNLYISAKDESGAYITLDTGIQGEPARRPADYRNIFEKLGNTPFCLENFENGIPNLFFPASALTNARRKLIDRLLIAKKFTYKFNYRKKENKDYPYPAKVLDYRDNVANSLALKFYKEHGVTSIEQALEVSGRSKAKGRKIMTTRHCILRELGLCLKDGKKLQLPLTLESGNFKFQPVFDCSSCEMHLIFNR